MAEPSQHELFICYSHTDSKYRDQFAKFLHPLRERTQLTIFSDGDIEPGDEWQKEIMAALGRVTAALILVSQDFMISPFIQQIELREILMSHVRRGLRLFLVPVRATNYQGTYLEKFQWARPPDKPLALLPDAQQEQAMVEVCLRIAYELNTKPDPGTIEQTIECLRSIPKLDLPPNYELGDLVGVGEFARCYRAEDRLIDRQVIIKVLDAELSNDSPAYDKYVRTATTLNHRNIVGVLFSQANKLPHFIVTPAIKGPTLEERLAARDETHPPPINEAVECTIRLAETLAYAHSRGCVHGRIRPCEVRFDAEMQPVLSGFRTLASLPSTSPLARDQRKKLDEFQYASPEQREGRVVNQKSDQYLLGLLAYQMIAGAPPASLSHWASILDPDIAHALVNPRPLKAFVAGCDGRVSDVIMRMLSVDPAARWDSLEIVKAELQKALSAVATSCVDKAKESYRRCAQDTEFYRTLYDNLFAAMPEIKGMFRDPSLERQYRMLRDALWLLLMFHETGGQEEPTILTGIARTHSQLPCDFDKFRDAVLDAVARHDGGDPAVIAAWRDAMKPGFEYLKSKAGRPAPAGA